MSYYIYVEDVNGIHINTPAVAVSMNRYDGFRCQTREQALQFLADVRVHMEVPVLTDQERLIAFKQHWRDESTSQEKAYLAINLEWIEEIILSPRFHTLYVG